MATVTDSRHTHDTPLTNQHLGHLLHLASSPLAPRVGRQLTGGRRRWCVGATLTSTPIPVLFHCTSFDTFLPSSLSWQANSCRQTVANSLSCKLLWYWIKWTCSSTVVAHLSPRPQITFGTWPCLCTASAWISTNGNSHWFSSAVLHFLNQGLNCVFRGKILF